MKSWDSPKAQSLVGTISVHRMFFFYRYSKNIFKTTQLSQPINSFGMLERNVQKYLKPNRISGIGCTAEAIPDGFWQHIFLSYNGAHRYKLVYKHL